MPHYRFHRLYLWLIPILSLTIPLIEVELDYGQEAVISESQLGSLPAENAATFRADDLMKKSVLAESKALNIKWILGIMYGIGLGFMGYKSLRPILQLRQSLAKTTLIQAPNVYAQPHSPFSFAFGKRIYLGADWKALETAEQDIVLRHEQAHIQLKHSYDLHYFHLLRALFWFHPAAHLILRSAKHLHEFQADQAVIESGFDFSRYAQVLLKLQTKHAAPAPFAFAFAQHPLTTRIKMLKTKPNWFQSSKRYLLAILLIGSLTTGIGSYFNSFGWLQIQLNPQAFNQSVSIDSIPIQTQAHQAIMMAQHTTPKLNPEIPEYQPINAIMAAGFGMRIHPIMKTQRLHSGLDYYAPIGTSVKASADGKVIFAGSKAEEYGNYGVQVIVQHANGYKTRYAHLDQVIVKVGDSVKQGQEIALSGNTGLSKGPHLHYEVIKSGRPIDPMPLFKPMPVDSFVMETHH